jgi:hypothetical protein
MLEVGDWIQKLRVAEDCDPLTFSTSNFQNDTKGTDVAKGNVPNASHT